MELRGDFTQAEIEKDFSRFGVVDNVVIKKLERGLRVACVDFKNPRVAINAKSAMQEQGKYGTITFWEVLLPSRTHAHPHHSAGSVPLTLPCINVGRGGGE